MMRPASLAVFGVLLLLLCAFPSAQPVFQGTDVFPLEEFVARRAKVMAQIGDGVAMLPRSERRRNGGE